MLFQMTRVLGLEINVNGRSKNFRTHTKKLNSPVTFTRDVYYTYFIISSSLVVTFLLCQSNVHVVTVAKSSSFSTMPPLNRQLTLIEVEDDHTRQRSTSPPSASTNDRHPCASPAGSCLSLDELELFKFVSHVRKRVTFKTGKELQQIKFIEPLREWVHGEYSSQWFSQEDYENFRRDVFHTIYLLRNRPECLDGVTFTARGTECRDPAVVERRQRVKRLAWQAVFDEQEACRKNASGKPSGRDDWMATIYGDLTRPALREALDLGASDAKESERIQNELSKKELTQDDAFSDDWIRSISSHCKRDDSASAFSKYEEGLDDVYGLCMLGVPSGFDDSWIRGN